MSVQTQTMRIALAMVTAAALTLTGATAATAVGPTTALSADAIAIGDYVAVTETGTDFRIHAAVGRSVTVDAHTRVSDRGETFSQRIKLNGSGTADARSLHFTVAADDVPTQVFVNARSGSGTADRAIALFGAAGEIARVPALADSAAQAVSTEAIDITVPGDYWLASPSSGVNVYYAQLGAFDDEERMPWAEVATPVIDGVTVDPTNPTDLIVQYSGVLGADGGDVVYATLFDSSGSIVDQTLDATDGASGSLVLTPPGSGDYQVEVRLTRAGEATPRTSPRADAVGFSLPLTAPTITGALTSGVTPSGATVTLTWSATTEAESYSVETSPAGGEFTTALSDVTATTADITGLTPGGTYAMRVVAHRGTETVTSAPFEVAVAGEVERWQSADVGSNAGSGGSVTENADDSITFDARASTTKLATSEDGFQYYFTEIDPATENFTLRASFRVDDASAKDSQSGFGVIAVDELVTEESAARYFNSAGALITRYAYGTGTGEWQDGTPGARFVQGYTGATTDNTAGARDSSDSTAFDWDWRPEVATGPKFADGDVYDLALRKSNTGFHAIWTRDGEELEVIQYDPEMLLQQNSEKLFVGMAVARKIAVTVTDWEFTTIHPDDDAPAEEPPMVPVAAALSVDVTTTTPESSLDIPLVSNMFGTGQILDASGAVIVDGIALAPGDRTLVPVSLNPGENALTVRLLPSAEQPHLDEREQIASTEPVDVPLTITVDAFGAPGESIWVAPDGTAEGEGTKASPLDIHTAVAFAQAGQQIVLSEGVYTPQRNIVAERGRNGSEGAPITLMSEPGTRAVLDLSQSPNGGLVLRGDWWHVYDLEITGSADKQKPMLIQGHHNVVERVESHHNRDTGIQISGSEFEPAALWPTDNLVVSSYAHNNADVGGNDADGFAAKLAVGEGNVFRHNIAHNNIDDGWDLYAKSTSGPIGTVVIEDSVAYDNGWLESDPSVTGEGNGFKLGGESIPGDHLLRNSITYGNLATGVTSNSGPDVRIELVTSVGNERGVRLETNAASTNYRATGVLSWQSPLLDTLALKQSDTSLLTDPSNIWNLGGDSPVAPGWFVSLDTDGVRPSIGADGSVDMQGLLQLTDAAPAATGARLSEIDQPTAIELYPEVTVPLVNTVSPSITGDPLQGETLTVNAGEWSHPDATITYQWLREGKPIPGRPGTEASYKVRGGDVGHDLSVAVTATIEGQDSVTVLTGSVTAERDAPPAPRIRALIQKVVGWLWALFI
ncbi:right-handed parallel beta-helix repeat-containing protein [Microbacterium lacus]|uniref:right-handed parallel beta-helix repeat-containing protein n=1 Tax=Microbacterium lacus TaxID=415217 RepID=UPI0038500024